MTPTELMTFARQRVNSVGDDLFSDSLLLDMIYAASMDLAKNAYLIERVYTATTVASTQEYAIPTNAFAIKRVTYDGGKLSPISFRTDDSLTLSNSTTVVTGQPQYYALFARTLYLRPIPDSALTLKIFSYNFPQRVVTTSALEIPDEYHTDMVLYLCSEMQAIEKNYQGAQYYRTLWDNRVKQIKDEQRKRMRADGFASVQDLDTLPTTLVDLV